MVKCCVRVTGVSLDRSVSRSLFKVSVIGAQEPFAGQYSRSSIINLVSDVGAIVSRSAFTIINISLRAYER